MHQKVINQSKGDKYLTTQKEKLIIAVENYSISINNVHLNITCGSCITSDMRVISNLSTDMSSSLPRVEVNEANASHSHKSFLFQ